MALVGKNPPASEILYIMVEEIRDSWKGKEDEAGGIGIRT